MPCLWAHHTTLQHSTSTSTYSTVYCTEQRSTLATASKIADRQQQLPVTNFSLAPRQPRSSSRLLYCNMRCVGERSPFPADVQYSLAVMRRCRDLYLYGTARPEILAICKSALRSESTVTVCYYFAGLRCCCTCGVPAVRLTAVRSVQYECWDVRTDWCTKTVQYINFTAGNTGSPEPTVQ